MNEGEKKVVSKMIKLYCKAYHNTSHNLCDNCDNLDSYAMQRLEKCPFGDQKPTCGTCYIHCYKRDMRLQIKEVMRYAGPRMIFRHPIATIKHFIREYKRRKLTPAAINNKSSNDTNY